MKHKHSTKIESTPESVQRRGVLAAGIAAHLKTNRRPARWHWPVIFDPGAGAILSAMAWLAGALFGGWVIASIVIWAYHAGHGR